MSEHIYLYRGIAVEERETDKVIEEIRSQGIINGKGSWNFECWNLRRMIPSLIDKKDLTTDNTRHGFQTFPCKNFADELGAQHYALVHNQTREKKVALIVKVAIDESCYYYIDGRDFLYPIFQMWDKKNIANQEGKEKAYSKLLAILKEVYGSKIEEYFQRAASSDQSDYRIAICELATHDFEISQSHSKNTHILGGRYSTVFRSSFFVQSPISPDRIVTVGVIKQFLYQFKPEFDVYSL
ncbi:MAG: hypothetical protein M1556_01235 [Candidatus Thermoplasmatota archaeon]|jgi:hypothetical protein|nr:hypothetical protein [Candidatus Thermoplasmatota archaeon]